MRKGRPKQHVHNWYLGFTKWTYEEKEHDSWGYLGIRYWRCVRGDRVKHTKAWEPRIGYGLTGENILLTENVYIMGSGILNGENTYRDSNRRGNRISR